MSLHRKITKAEEKEFKQWARDNYSPGTVIPLLWHPVIVAECNLMDYELSKIEADAHVE